MCWMVVKGQSAMWWFTKYKAYLQLISEMTWSGHGVGSWFGAWQYSPQFSHFLFQNGPEADYGFGVWTQTSRILTEDIWTVSVTELKFLIIDDQSQVLSIQYIVRNSRQKKLCIRSTAVLVRQSVKNVYICTCTCSVQFRYPFYLSLLLKLTPPGLVTLMRTAFTLRGRS